MGCKLFLIMTSTKMSVKGLLILLIYIFCYYQKVFRTQMYILNDNNNSTLSYSKDTIELKIPMQIAFPDDMKEIQT